ncbi:transcription antitermination factor NusB [Effusibacillus lacus]|uniref:Transcription antitermination protein NusB n=1 Tax=Effusibacillus lacus TaxID=1348429 RepID=A0A292YQ76_9BACL|nr:transcription antitermination factor NusB [Effusibacillus lacus]TCS72523.1 NusB antitermination factor [Effusibacillus lacus]GAX90913.1 N utilization substance protein B [Effusibacillus lacus]
MSRRQLRESVLQSLFQIHMGEVPVPQAISHVLEEAGSDIDRGSLEKFVSGTYDNLPQIDSLIRQYSIGWELDRMPSVDLTILRMAVYEMIYEQDTPAKVVINEAIELAKAFSTADSGKFVNGVLGKMLPDLDRLRSSVQNDSGN